MKQSVLDLQTNVQTALADAVVASDIKLNELTIELAPAKALEAFEKLKNDLGFELLIDVCGVDYLAYGDTTWETRKATKAGFSVVFSILRKTNPMSRQRCRDGLP